MKIDPIKSIIALSISALISYGLYNFHDSDNRMLLTIGSFLFIAITLLVSIGVSFGPERTSMVITSTSALFFIIALVSNIVFSFMSSFSEVPYIIINGILFLVFMLIVNSVAQAKQ
jgi:hypothetical protein